MLRVVCERWRMMKRYLAKDNPPPTRGTDEGRRRVPLPAFAEKCVSSDECEEVFLLAVTLAANPPQEYGNGEMALATLDMDIPEIRINYINVDHGPRHGRNSTQNKYEEHGSESEGNSEKDNGRYNKKSNTGAI